MIIGIDLDDTINNLATTFTKYAKIYNQSQNISHIIQENEWGFDKAFGWDEFHESNFQNMYLKILFTEVNLKEKAKEIINKLKDDGNEIVIITARSRRYIPDVFEVSDEWLQKNKIKYDKLVIEGKDKVDKCIENNVDIFIDDIANNCEQVYSKAKIPVYLFDSIFNKEYFNPNIKRVLNWEEVYKEIKKYGT